MRRMPNGPSRFRLSLTALAIALLLIGADVRQAWDQTAVTSLAADLAKTTRELKNTLRREPTLASTLGLGDRKAIGFWEAIDGLEKSSRQLARRTKDGEGHDDTLPIARKIRTLVRDAEQFGAGDAG